MQEICGQLAETLAKTTYSALPENVIKYTKMSILDTLGVNLAGSMYPGSREVVSMVKSWGGTPEATIIASGMKTPAPAAALANGATTRAPDFDDVHEEASCHPSHNVIPGSFAMAERIGEIAGKDFILAVALGVDIIGRIGRSLKYNCIWTGRHNLFRIFGAAAGPGRILGLDKEKMWNLLGIAYTMVTGVELQGNLCDGALTLRLQSGLVAEGGVRAAILAQMGYSGARNVFYGKYGFYTVYEPEHDVKKVLEGLGEHFEGSNCRIKLYPCCSGTHKSINAVIDVITENKINPDDIESIEVGLNERALRYLCTPEDVKYNPRTAVDAQFSIPYLASWACINKNVFFDAFDSESLNNSKVREILTKVRTLVDRDIEKEYPNIPSPARVTIYTKGGYKFSKRVDYPKGHPLNPMSMEDVVDKFYKCLNYAQTPIKEKNIDQLIDMVINLDKIENASVIPSLLAGEVS